MPTRQRSSHGWLCSRALFGDDVQRRLSASVQPFVSPSGALIRLLRTDVLQFGRSASIGDARHGAQILIDCPDLTVGHRLKHRPGHDLKERAIEWWRNAIRVRGASTGGMEVIQIRAGSKDQKKLRKGAPAFRHSGYIRRQVSRDN